MNKEVQASPEFYPHFRPRDKLFAMKSTLRLHKILLTGHWRDEVPRPKKTTWLQRRRQDFGSGGGTF